MCSVQAASQVCYEIVSSMKLFDIHVFDVSENIDLLRLGRTTFCKKGARGIAKGTQNESKRPPKGEPWTLKTYTNFITDRTLGRFGSASSAGV